MIFPDINTTVVHRVYYRDNDTWNHPVNIYPYNTLYLILKGDGQIRIGDHTTALLPGHIYLIPPNTLFSCWCENYIEKIYIDFHAEILPGLDVFRGNRLLSSVVPIDDIKELITRGTTALPEGEDPAFKYLQPTDLAGKLWFDSILLKLMSQLLPDDWQAPATQVLRHRAILDEIETNLSASLRMGDIARRHGWHPSALSRAFQKDFGCSIKEYSENLLSARLRQELVTTDKTIRELAAQYQFNDAYYMSAFFKRREGVSPSAYRRTNTRRMVSS